MKKSKTKMSVSDLKREADRLIATGKMPTFEQLADAIAQSPSAQKLLAIQIEGRAKPSRN